MDQTTIKMLLEAGGGLGYELAVVAVIGLLAFLLGFLAGGYNGKKT